MSKQPPKPVRSSRFRESRLPVLTEAIDADVPEEPPVRLAWDSTTLPVLTEVIEQEELRSRRRSSRRRA